MMVGTMVGTMVGLHAGDVRWKIKKRHSRKIRASPGLVAAIQAHCNQAQIEPGDLSGWLTTITKHLHLNGHKWKRGTQCRYRLPTDIASQRSLRIGILDYCVVVPTAADDGSDFLIAAVIESHLFNTINGLAIVDVTHAPPRASLFHISHIVSLVMFADYWDARARHLKVVLHVASTR